MKWFDSPPWRVWRRAALIAAAVGFGGIAGVAMDGARLLFWVFIVLFVLSLIAGLIRRRT